MLRWAVGGVLLLLLAGWPMPRAVAALAEESATLIRKLNHGNLAVRETAVDGLLALGPSALPAIERAIPIASAAMPSDRPDGLNADSCSMVTMTSCKA